MHRGHPSPVPRRQHLDWKLLHHLALHSMRRVVHKHQVRQGVSVPIPQEVMLPLPKGLDEPQQRGYRAAFVRGQAEFIGRLQRLRPAVDQLHLHLVRRILFKGDVQRGVALPVLHREELGVSSREVSDDLDRRGRSARAVEGGVPPSPARQRPAFHCFKYWRAVFPVPSLLQVLVRFEQVIEDLQLLQSHHVFQSVCATRGA
mmetsp:Transcript_53507/g.160115  ORF Transcript_53507/g.160115 Transcript_53507/m.160115 type:complete len:202 (-) Transcript_53507:761-1366(-)